MTEIRIERKRRPWWLLILVLLIAVAIGAWLYYNETVNQTASDMPTIGSSAPPVSATPLIAA